MARDLTTSQVDRQNILNNENAVAEIQNQTGLQGIMFEGRLRFTKAMVASFFEVEVRTIERYVSENIEEISANGYEVIKGKRLKDFLNCVLDQDVPDINVGNILIQDTIQKIFQSFSFNDFVSIRRNFLNILTNIAFNSSNFNLKKGGDHCFSETQATFKHYSLKTCLILDFCHSIFII